jgi:hypothetical protein
VAWLAFRANVVFFGLIAVFSSILLSLVYTPSPNSLAPLVLANIFQVSGESRGPAIRLGDPHLCAAAAPLAATSVLLCASGGCVGLPPPPGPCSHAASQSALTFLIAACTFAEQACWER